MTNSSNHGNIQHSILHIVKPNDTFYELARTYHTTVQSIISLNPSANPRNLQIGTALLIMPGANWRDTTNTTSNQNNQTTSIVWPNRVHPIERPSTEPTKPDPSWSIFDNTSLPRTQSLQPSTRPMPINPISPQPLPSVPVVPRPTPISPTNPMPIPQPIPQPITPQPMPIAPTLPSMPRPVPIEPTNPQQPLPIAPIPLPAQIVQHCNQSSLCSQMRLLWAQHVYWTRMLLTSIVDRTQQINANTNRLMQNPVDMGQLFARYYGSQAGQTLSNLFGQHLSVGKDLMTNMRDRRNGEVERLRRQWYANADDIATFLSSLVPAIDNQELRRMLYQHLGNTELEIAQQLGNNTEASINTFDNIEHEAMNMADYLSNAVLGDN